MPREFFRSQREQGRIKQSAYDDCERACAVARKFGFRPGSYVVKIVVPEEAGLEIRQTFDDPHHLTIYAQPELVLALVEGDALLTRGAPGRGE